MKWCCWREQPRRRQLILLVCLCCLPTFTLTLASSSWRPPRPTPQKILVTGASGRTGRLVVEQLRRDDRYEPVALVRSQASGKNLLKALSLDLNQIVVCDVTGTALRNETEIVPYAMRGCTAMIICTSAVPTVSKQSLLLAFLKAPWNIIRGKKAIDFRSLRFVWKHGGTPEIVDYEGQVYQIKLAQRLGITQVIVVSSMGGTDPTNFLNSLGKRRDGSGGDILLWKRRAEKYLVESGLAYTILHPGGLSDEPPGQEDFVLDVDDKLTRESKKMISRSDVASLCVAALSVAAGKKVSLDCITQKRVVNGESKVRSAEQALAEFLSEAKVYDYAL